MKNNFYINISLNVFMVFITVIFISFIPDAFPWFFGDTFCKGGVYIGTVGNVFSHWEGCDEGINAHLPTWHWGYRHWLFIMMGIVLFIIQAVRIIVLIDKHSKDGK